MIAVLKHIPKHIPKRAPKRIPKRILVTGGAGFIGGHFLDFLLDASLDSTDLQILSIDRLTYATQHPHARRYTEQAHTKQVYTKHIQELQGCIGDRDLMRQVLQDFRPDAIVNFAAETHVDRSIHDPTAFIHTNIVATQSFFQSVLEYHKNTSTNPHFCLLHISTDEVFGQIGEDDAPLTETAPYAPNNPYAASKAAADHILRAYQNTYKLPSIISHSSNNYGPRQHPEKLIPSMISKALAGEPLTIYGSGQQIRDWLYVRDHCAALWMLLQYGELGERYNIGGIVSPSNPYIRNLDVVRQICLYLDQLAPRTDGSSYQTQISFVADRLGHDFRYALDSQKIQSCTPWRPQTAFLDGLFHTVRSHLDAGGTRRNTGES